MPRRCCRVWESGRDERVRRKGLAAGGKEEKERAAGMVLCVRWKTGVAALLLRSLLLLVLTLLVLVMQARGRKKLAAEKA